jgi:hypothetical protein
MSAGGSFWLKNWAEINGHSGTNPHVGKYIGIYFAFGIGNAALVVLQTLILWIFCSIEVSSHPLEYTLHLHRQRGCGCTKALVCSRTCMKARHTLAWTSVAGLKDAWRIWRPRSLLTRGVGFAKAAREDGIRYLPQPDELLRDNSERSYSQSVLKVCFLQLHPSDWLRRPFKRRPGHKSDFVIA